jgi:hypothetical protein
MVFGAKYKNHITKTNKHSESGKMKHEKHDLIASQVAKSWTVHVVFMVFIVHLIVPCVQDIHTHIWKDIYILLSQLSFGIQLRLICLPRSEHQHRDLSSKDERTGMGDCSGSGAASDWHPMGFMFDPQLWIPRFCRRMAHELQ